MRRMRGVLLVLLTAVLVAGGAMLPYIASLVQDRYLESEVDVWTFDPVGLRLGDEPAVWPALCLMAGECEWLGWNSETNLSEEEAKAAAREAAVLLEKSGLAEPGVAGVGLDEMWTESVLLVSGGVRGLSAVLWNCSWNVVDSLGNFLFCNLLIDDSTGKLVQVTVRGWSQSTPRWRIGGRFWRITTAWRWRCWGSGRLRRPSTTREKGQGKRWGGGLCWSGGSSWASTWGRSWGGRRCVWTCWRG